jgi:hypothetical protein
MGEFLEIKFFRQRERERGLEKAAREEGGE